MGIFVVGVGAFTVGAGEVAFPVGDGEEDWIAGVDDVIIVEETGMEERRVLAEDDMDESNEDAGFERAENRELFEIESLVKVEFEAFVEISLLSLDAFIPE